MGAETLAQLTFDTQRQQIKSAKQHQFCWAKNSNRTGAATTCQGKNQPNAKINESNTPGVKPMNGFASLYFQTY